MVIPAAAAWHGLLDLATYRYFFYHAMVVCAGLYLYWSKPIEYTIKSYGSALAIVSLSSVVAIWLNAFFGWDHRVNHMFIVRPPFEGLPILNLNHGWPVYMLALASIAVVLITVCYLPVIVKRLTSRSSASTS
jgi:uncharacterized membrane protein YwaF